MITIEIDGKYYKAYNVNDYPYTKQLYNATTVRKRKSTIYYNISAAFDIETTTIHHDDTMSGFMYHWQFAIQDTVCFGRTWTEYIEFIDKLHTIWGLSDHKRLVVYVHNLSFEFQFFKDFFDISSIFARKKRQVITAVTNGIEYRCSYKLSNMSLSRLCANSKLCTLVKRGEYNYRKLRTPSTPMDNDELGYCYCDVVGLTQCIDTYLLDDTIASIPLTSTGFVRRECRKAMQSNPKNYELMQKIKLDVDTFTMCKKASRGGNTHANAIHSNQILDNVKSMDKKSSYPASMMYDKYPMSKFMQVTITSREQFDRYTSTYACLIELVMDKVHVKTMRTIPYIARAKCETCVNPRIDNGRVISADRIVMTITDVDWAIINNHYHIYGGMVVTKMYIAKYGYLPDEFRRLLMDYFTQKCLLEEGDPYLYAKYKNKINSFFGMMLTDIASPEIIYNPDNEEQWDMIVHDTQSMLDRYYKNRKSFLSYQWGVWVTANARKRLQDAIDMISTDNVYIDTDSDKYINDHDADFAKLNTAIIQECINNDIPAYVTYTNSKGEQTAYLGLWECDAVYDQFKTIGAKKYCYVKDDKLHITVSGLHKELGAAYLTEHGGIDAFDIGMVIPEGHSGRTVAKYNDCKVHTINVNGEDILTASNIGIDDTSYTLGITLEYKSLLDTIDNFF